MGAHDIAVPPTKPHYYPAVGEVVGQLRHAYPRTDIGRIIIDETDSSLIRKLSEHCEMADLANFRRLSILRQYVKR